MTSGAEGDAAAHSPVFDKSKQPPPKGFVSWRSRLLWAAPGAECSCRFSDSFSIFARRSPLFGLILLSKGARAHFALASYRRMCVPSLRRSVHTLLPETVLWKRITGLSLAVSLMTWHLRAHFWLSFRATSRLRVAQRGTHFLCARYCENFAPGCTCVTHSSRLCAPRIVHSLIIRDCRPQSGRHYWASRLQRGLRQQCASYERGVGCRRRSEAWGIVPI